MRAMILERTVPTVLDAEPLRLVEIPRPKASDRQVLLKVKACGVCHTELDEIEGRTPPPKYPIIPGHEVVGEVVAMGPGVTRHQLGDRLGVGWIFSSDGSPYENLSPKFRATGRDAHGGYAEYMIVDQDYAFPIPDSFSDTAAAPLLCAGSVGFRALRLANLQDGQSLGLTGFGGCAHLVIQMTRHLFPKTEVFVFARDPEERNYAMQLGATWAGDIAEAPPIRLNSIIDTTPAWTPVVEAMKCLQPGGRLVINAIRKQDADKSALLRLDYGQHLWMEREIKSVANVTGKDISEFLQLAAKIQIRPQVECYDLEQANQALRDLRRGSVVGAKVLRMHAAD